MTASDSNQKPHASPLPEVPALDCPTFFHDWYQGTDSRVWTLTLLTVAVGSDDVNAPVIAVAHTSNEHLARVFQRERIEGDNTAAIQRGMIWMVMLLGYVPNEQRSPVALLRDARTQARRTLAEGGR